MKLEGAAMTKRPVVLAFLVGALVAGGYLGFAVSWVGVEAELAGQRIVRSLLAGLAGLLITIGALWLERACRVPKDDDEP